MTKREAADVVRAVRLVSDLEAEVYKLGRSTFSVGLRDAGDRYVWTDVYEAQKWIVTRSRA